MLINPNEIMETIRMVRMEHLDIRTVTMGISLRDCSHPDIEVFNENIYEKNNFSCKGPCPDNE